MTLLHEQGRISSCVSKGSCVEKWICQNVSSLTVQHGKNAPHWARQGRKSFQAWNIHVQPPESPITSLLHSPLFWHKRDNRWSSGFQFKLWKHIPDCPSSFYPPHCKSSWESQTNRAGNNYATASVASSKDNRVIITMFLKTSTSKGPIKFTQFTPWPLCILTTIKIFLNLLFLATYSAYYFYFIHCGHCRFYFLICQTSSCSPSSSKALILSFSFYSC